MGGRSSSSSAATTSNQDNRIAVQDGIGLSASSGNVISITDGGMVARGLDTVDRTISQAVESVNLTSANNTESYSNLLNTTGDSFAMLLGAAESLWNRGENLLDQTRQTFAQAYSQAESDKGGTIDQRTVIVLAVAGAATLALIANRGNK